MKLYVGSLSDKTTSEILRTAFEKFGTVKSATRPIREGHLTTFGFVQMPNYTEARAAISALNGSKLDGQTIKIAQLSH